MKASDLKTDDRNARARTTRNRQLIAQSLAEVGAARSIVIDENDTVLAGNGVHEAAALMGLKVKVVEADGKTLIAVRRTGLTDTQKQALALYDNRANELSVWDPARLNTIAIENAGMLDTMFTKAELESIFAKLPTPESDAGEGGVGGGEEGLPDSGIRQVALFFSESQHGMFMEAITVIMAEGEYESVTDAVMGVVQDAYRKGKRGANGR